MLSCVQGPGSYSMLGVNLEVSRRNKINLRVLIHNRIKELFSSISYLALPHAIRTNKLIDVTLEPARLHTLQDK